MKVKVSELTEAALDWAVTRCIDPEIGLEQFMAMHGNYQYGKGTFEYSTEWALGGQIIEHNVILLDGFSTDGCAYKSWSASMLGMVNESGPTPLISAMRCLVASKFGVEVEIPEELCKL